MSSRKKPTTAAAAGTISTTESTSISPTAAQETRLSRKPTSPIQGSVTVSGRSQPSAEHHRPEHQRQRRDRQPERAQQHPQEARVAELAERAREVDEKAHPSTQVVSAATSGRGRSGGGAAQLPI